MMRMRAVTRGSWIAFTVLLLGCSTGGLVFTTDVRGTAAPVSWIAYQDGDQPWQTVRVEGNRYRVPIRSGRFGLAMVCEEEPQVQIIHATTRELPAFQVSFTGGLGGEGWPPTYMLACTGMPYAIYTISGTVVGVRPNHAVVDDYIDYGPPYEYEQKVPAGTRDLVLLEMPDSSRLREGGHPTRIVLMRDVVVDNDKRIDVDFNRDGFAPLARTMTLRGRLPGEAVWFSPTFFTPLGTDVPLGTVLNEKRSVFRFGAVPPERRRPGDLHRMEVEVEDENAGATRCVVRDALAPEDLVLDLPPPLTSAAAAVVARQPYFRFRATWKPYPGAQVYRLTYAHVGPGGDVPELHWEVLLTAGWLEGTSSYTLPDFSTLAGWSRDWGLKLEPVPPGEQRHETLSWRVEAVSSNAGPSAIVGSAALRPVADGDEVRCAGREGDEGWVGP